MSELRLFDDHKNEFEVHPAAECVRMMTDEEFQRLVADIAANGLLEPIKLGRVNGESPKVIDGRNRLKACDQIGVSPEFVTLEFESEAELRSYIGSMNERRDISKGERAMMLALLYPDGGKPAPGRRDPVLTELETISVSFARVKQARQVFRHSPELAYAVRDGLRKLDDALDEVKAKQAALASEAEMLSTLQVEAPDLADRVAEEQLKLTEAFAAFRQRKAEAEAAEHNKRETLFRMAEALYRGGAAFAVPSFVGEIHQRLSDQQFRRELADRLRLDGKPDDIEAGAAALAAILGEINHA